MHEDWDSNDSPEINDSQINSDIEAALYEQIYYVSDTQYLADISVESSESNVEKILHEPDVIDISSSNNSDVRIISEKKKIHKRKSERDNSCKLLKIKTHLVKKKNISIYSLTSSSDEDWHSICNEKQENISLNLIDPWWKFINSPSNKSDENWSVDLEDQYRKRQNNARYCRTNNFCTACRRMGHKQADCFLNRKITCYLCGGNHQYIYCSNKVCKVCGDFKHSAKSCPYHAPRCRRCKIKGHHEKICPDIWRQYYLTTKLEPVVKGLSQRAKKIYCYNCTSKGHYGYLCKKKRMSRKVYPATPFIISYSDPLLKNKHHNNQNNLKNCKKVKTLSEYSINAKDGGRKKNQSDILFKRTHLPLQTILPCDKIKNFKKIKKRVMRFYSNVSKKPFMSDLLFENNGANISINEKSLKHFGKKFKTRLFTDDRKTKKNVKKKIIEQITID